MQSALPSARSVFPTNPSALKVSFNRSVRQVGAIGNSLPPSFLVLFSSFVIQLGMAMSKILFEAIGSSGAAFLCKGMAAIFLVFLLRPQWQGHRWQAYGIVGLFGLCIACMNLSIYAAIDRIPLGVASTLEFVGPLGLAIAGSRRPVDLVWVALAAIGVFLLAPFHGTLDPVGVGFALLSGLCWSGYILLSAPAGRAIPGGGGLAIGITVAALIMAPFGISQGGIELLNPWIIGIGIAAALLSTVVPYSLEFVALRRMPPRIFGVLMSIEPAIAALVGLLFLNETLDGRSLVAIALVILAAIGATVLGRQEPKH